jgi:uncharacterized protein YciI
MSSAILIAVALLGAEAPTVDGTPAEVPPEIAALVPKNLRNYFLVFVVTPPQPKPMSGELFVRHQAYLRKQVEAGAIRLVGPVTNGNRIRGIKIISAASIDEARKIAEGDPAVQEDVLDVEVHPVTLPSLATLKIEYADPK